MISIRGLNSYTASTGAIKSSPENISSKPSTKPEKENTHSIPNQHAVNEYSNVIENDRDNKQSFFLKDNLSYSTLNAVRQYTNNANMENKEKAQQMLGLNVFA